MVSFSLHPILLQNMKYLFFTTSGILMAFSVFFACQKPGEPKERVLYYKDSKAVMRRYFTINDKIEGEMTEYYEDGKTKLVRQFKNGQEEGTNRLFYPDGKLKETQTFVTGLKQGGDTLFYPTGKPQFIVTFKDGKKDGLLQKWTLEGSLFFEAVYDKDSLKGVTTINKSADLKSAQ
jgi:antitoxin component YwqK of YwqJK toxin-antitoxin module